VTDELQLEVESTPLDPDGEPCCWRGLETQPLRNIVQRKLVLTQVILEALYSGQHSSRWCSTAYSAISLWNAWYTTTASLASAILKNSKIFHEEDACVEFGLIIVLLEDSIAENGSISAVIFV
jgi:hypothetical protein